MSYSTNMNNSSTTLDQQTNTNGTYTKLDINPTDWTKTECSRDRLVFVNANSDYSAPNHYRIERSRIANVYDGTGISTNYQLPSKRGVKLFMQCNSVATLSESTDPTVRLELPYAASLTLRVPAVPTNIVSYDNVATVLRQLVGFLTPNNHSAGTSVVSSCLSKYLNGSLDFTSWS